MKIRKTPGPRLHLFDVDFTIVRTSTVKDFLFHTMLRGILPLRLGFYVPWFFILLTSSNHQSSPLNGVFSVLAGIPKKSLEESAARVFRKKTIKHIDPIIARRIGELKARGDRVVLASSSFKTVIEPLAAHLGLGEIIASELEFDNGVTTGKIKGIPAFQDGKRIKVLEFLEKEGLLPTDCSFYSDSYRDLPLLNIAGKPVAVNPSRKLRRFASEKGWEIIISRPEGKFFITPLQEE